MSLLLVLLGYILVVFLATLLFGAGGTAVVTILAWLIMTVVGEVYRTNCIAGREQIRREQIEQEEYENEFGIIQSKDR